jgi:hypothetical protein
MRPQICADFHASTSDSYWRPDILPRAPAREEPVERRLARGGADLRVHLRADSSQTPPGFLISGVVRRKTTKLNPATSMCSSGWRVSAQVFPP